MQNNGCGSRCGQHGWRNGRGYKSLLAGPRPPECRLVVNEDVPNIRWVCNNVANLAQRQGYGDPKGKRFNQSAYPGAGEMKAMSKGGGVC